MKSGIGIIETRAVPGPAFHGKMRDLTMESVFLGKFYPLLKDSMKEMIAAGFFLFQTTWRQIFKHKFHDFKFSPDITKKQVDRKLYFYRLRLLRLLR